MSNINYYCVIMAGGIGRRFWPYSRKALPKQFLDFFGTGRTLLQQTYDRYKQIIPPENIYITTHRDYKELVKNLLPEVDESRLIVEEERRNTAPAIAYASHVIQKVNPDATIVVAPSDHLILGCIVLLRQRRLKDQVHVVFCTRRIRPRPYGLPEGRLCGLRHQGDSLLAA